MNAQPKAIPVLSLFDHNTPAPKPKAVSYSGTTKCSTPKVYGQGPESQASRIRASSWNWTAIMLTLLGPTLKLSGKANVAWLLRLQKT